MPLQIIKKIRLNTACQRQSPLSTDTMKARTQACRGLTQQACIDQTDFDSCSFMACLTLAGVKGTVLIRTPMAL